MPAYKAETKTIETWQRCHRIVFEMPLDGVSLIDFLEEVVTVTGGKKDAEKVSGCSLAFDPLARIMLRDPITGALLGTSLSHGELYAVVYSAYRMAAERRDKPKAKTATPPI